MLLSPPVSVGGGYPLCGITPSVGERGAMVGSVLIWIFPICRNSGYFLEERNLGIVFATIILGEENVLR